MSDCQAGVAACWDLLPHNSLCISSAFYFVFKIDPLLEVPSFVSKQCVFSHPYVMVSPVEEGSLMHSVTNFSDWQSESNLDSIRNSCDVISKFSRRSKNTSNILTAPNTGPLVWTIGRGLKAIGATVRYFIALPVIGHKAQMLLSPPMHRTLLCSSP